jgi:hypothetical protein
MHLSLICSHKHHNVAKGVNHQPSTSSNPRQATYFLVLFGLGEVMRHGRLHAGGGG